MKNVKYLSTHWHHNYGMPCFTTTWSSSLYCGTLRNNDLDLS